MSTGKHTRELYANTKGIQDIVARLDGEGHTIAVFYHKGYAEKVCDAYNEYDQLKAENERLKLKLDATQSLNKEGWSKVQAYDNLKEKLVAENEQLKEIGKKLQQRSLDAEAENERLREANKELTDVATRLIYHAKANNEFECDSGLQLAVEIAETTLSKYNTTDK